MEDGMRLVIKYLVKLQNEILKLSATMKGQRRGQSYMNALAKLNPRVYNRLRGTIVDCFYLDEKIPAFWGELTQAVLDYQLTDNN